MALKISIDPNIKANFYSIKLLIPLTLHYPPIYTVFQKSDTKIEITITTTNVIRIKYPLSSFNYRLSGTDVANFNIQSVAAEIRRGKKRKIEEDR